MGEVQCQGSYPPKFSLQIFLTLFSPLRKRTTKGTVLLFLWSAYLVADLAANFCIGLITNNYEGNSKSFSTINDFLFAFWGPFLLLHLGGPDTITSFSLEDNQLWLRHLLGLIFQLGATAYVFFLTLPANTLWLPTLLIFVAGIIKYLERTRSLQLACISTFRQSMVRRPDSGPNYAKLMEEYKSRDEAGLPSKIIMMPEPDEAPESEAKAETNKTNSDKTEEVLDDMQVVHDALDFFNSFKGIIVDMIFSFQDRNKSRGYFLERTPEYALKVIEVELNFFYEIFYTKVSVVRNKVGYFFRFVSVGSVVAALVLFFLAEKHGITKFDIDVTYTLLYGAVALDSMALLMLFFSDRTVASVYAPPEKIASNRALICIRKFRDNSLKLLLGFNKLEWNDWRPPSDDTSYPDVKFKALSGNKYFRRWSRSISGHNLIAYCLKRYTKNFNKIDSQGLIKKGFAETLVDYFGAAEFLDKWKYAIKYPLLKELWEFIFKELKRKSEDAEDVETTQRICSARGEWFLQEGELSRDDISKLMPYVEANQVTFDESLLLWHIATHLIYHIEDDEKSEDGEKRDDGEKRNDVEKGDDGGEDDGEQDQNTKEKKEKDQKECRHFSKLMSDYMLYLLIMQPTMMSAVAGIGQIRFQDTCAEAIKFFSKRDVVSSENQLKNAYNAFCKKLQEAINRLFRTKNNRGRVSTGVVDQEEKVVNQKACKKLLEVSTDYKPIEVKGDRSKSLLFDGCRLAKELRELRPKHKIWEIIAKVWVELMSFAACNCRPITHVQQLNKGGEFISLVWLLMTHLGLGKQFQIKEGHARAKLIVGTG